MREAPSRPGPGAEVWAVERFLRKRQLLEKGERILELKHGRIRRWLVDGSDQPVPALHGLERIPVFSGAATLSYSPRFLFCVGGDKFAGVDLSLIVRIWCTEPRSVCVIYSTVEEQPAGALTSIRWDFDALEVLEDLVGFADRIRMRARDRRAGFSADLQARIETQLSEIM